MRTVEFHAPASGGSCAVTFYTDGTCTLHHKDPFDMLWTIECGKVFQVWKHNNVKANHCEYIQDAYEAHICELIERNLMEKE